MGTVSLGVAGWKAAIALASESLWCSKKTSTSASRTGGD